MNTQISNIFTALEFLNGKLQESGIEDSQIYDALQSIHNSANELVDCVNYMNCVINEEQNTENLMMYLHHKINE